MLRAKAGVLGAIGVAAGVMTSGCDQPLLSADFSGPPAGTVEGTVTRRPGGSEGTGGVGNLPEPKRPRMSIEWLVGGMEPSAEPMGQTVTFRRSGALGEDRVEIALANPRPEARFQLGGTAAHVAVGKIFYYDDRNENASLDWDCDVGCDVVRSRSRQYLVFVESPPDCQAKAPTMEAELFAGSAPRAPSRGYHYFSFEDGVIMEQAPDAGLDLDLVDMTPAEANPTLDLARFSSALASYWLETQAGCP